MRGTTLSLGECDQRDPIDGTGVFKVPPWTCWEHTFETGRQELDKRETVGTGAEQTLSLGIGARLARKQREAFGQDSDGHLSNLWMSPVFLRATLCNGSGTCGRQRGLTGGRGILELRSRQPSRSARVRGESPETTSLPPDKRACQSRGGGGDSRASPRLSPWWYPRSNQIGRRGLDKPLSCPCPTGAARSAMRRRGGVAEGASLTG